MTTIVIFTKEELESIKLTEITDHYNEVAKLIGLKAVKKFRDKLTAVSRTLDAQETYRDDLETAAKAAAKESTKASKALKLAQNQGFAAENTFYTAAQSPKNLETAMGILWKIANNKPDAKISKQELCDLFLEEYAFCYKGTSKLTMSFAKGYVSGAVRAGHLTTL